MKKMWEFSTIIKILKFDKNKTKMMRTTNTNKDKDLFITNNKPVNMSSLNENYILPLKNGLEIKLKSNRMNNASIWIN